MMCGSPTGDGPTGRRRIYCSPACKQRAYRARTWQGTARQSALLRSRAARLACALINKAACVHILLTEPEPTVVHASASALTQAALDDVRELLQVLER